MKTPILILKSLLLSLVFAASAWATEKVNINTASAADLDRVLVNVGPSKAEAIVEYRRAHGPFRNADELAQVKGIGLKTVDKNRDLIEVGSARTAPRTPAGGSKAAPVRPVTRR
jgi:competence protein ComEA